MTEHRDTSSPSTGSSNKAESESPYPENDHLDNEALERCVNAWRRNFELASINPRDENLHRTGGAEENLFAIEQGAEAYRNAMPLLAGYENIRDFIACVAYGMLKNIFCPEESRDLLAAAKIAMALLKKQPTPTPPAA